MKMLPKSASRFGEFHAAMLIRRVFTIFALWHLLFVSSVLSWQGKYAPPRLQHHSKLQRVGISTEISGQEYTRLYPFKLSTKMRCNSALSMCSSSSEDMNNADKSALATTNESPLPAATTPSAAVTKLEGTPRRSKRKTLLGFLKSNWLIIGEILVIYFAKKNPAFFASGGWLRPEFYISKVGVFTIFFINGIALSVSGSPSEMQSAYKTNLCIQLFNFGVIPLAAKFLAPLYPDPAFRDGLLVLSVLPCTINICVAQTLAAGGNMACAIFNAIFANIIGVFLTPLLAVWMLGAGKGVSLLSTLNKLGGVVIFPLALGQICRMTPLGPMFQRISGYSRTLSSCLLLAIVYNVFSDTFLSGIGVGGTALANLIVAMPIVYLLFSAIFWQVSKFLLPGLDPPTKSAALFCSSQKTLAFGIPFIKMALGHRSDIAYILAPLLMYAPAQLLLGSSLLVPAMARLNRRTQEVGGDGAGI